MQRTTRLALILVVAATARALSAQTPATEPEVGALPPGTTAQTAATGPFAGGVPSGEASAEVLRLTLADVVARGMEHNLGRILADERVRGAAAAHALARSRLLPSLAVTASQARALISLDEFGFPVAPGESPLIGPFDVLDMRLALESALLDPAGLARTRAARAGEEAARHGLEDARELVVTVCTALYLQVVAGESRLTATRAQVETAAALDARARTLKDAGVVAAIDVLRAQFQLAAQRQREIDARDQLAKGRLALARTIGLPLAQPFELVEREAYAGLGQVEAGAAITRALADREEVKAQEALVRSTEASLAAARNERWPSLWLHADWGQVGPDSDGLNATYRAAVLLRMPLFAGGAIAAREDLAAAALEQQRAALADLRARVELEVRAALLDVAAADERVKVAAEQDALAAAQLAQAQDRFTAGVSNNLEVVQAQEAVAAASDATISSRTGRSLARLRLARALGAAAAGEAQGGSR